VALLALRGSTEDAQPSPPSEQQFSTTPSTPLPSEDSEGPRKRRKLGAGNDLAAAINGIREELREAREQRAKERETTTQKAFRVLFAQYRDADLNWVINASKVLQQEHNAELFLAANTPTRDLILSQLITQSNSEA
jgi:hypothetical protein